MYRFDPLHMVVRENAYAFTGEHLLGIPSGIESMEISKPSAITYLTSDRSKLLKILSATS